MGLTLQGYTELRVIGRGATGTVWVARHDPSGTLVAVKRLAPDLLGDAEFREGFRAEARLLAELEHPNIARLYGYVETQSEAAMVMELIDGVSVRAMLGRTAQTPEGALLLLRGALRALEAAHAAGVVHRDVKPDNAIVAGDGGSRLIDFGLARRRGEAGRPAGTPPYVPPEQWAGASASPQGDVYAAAVTCYECLSGRVPFEASELGRLRLQHERAPVPVEALPVATRELIARGMAKRAEHRYPSAGVFLAELEAAAQRGYGADWAERGRLALTAAVGSLAVLLPLTLLGHGATASAAVGGVTGTATTTTVTGTAVQSLPHATPPPAGSSVSPAPTLSGPASLPAAPAHSRVLLVRGRRGFRHLPTLIHKPLALAVAVAVPSIGIAVAGLAATGHLHGESTVAPCATGSSCSPATSPPPSPSPPAAAEGLLPIPAGICALLPIDRLSADYGEQLRPLSGQMTAPSRDCSYFTPNPTAQNPVRFLDIAFYAPGTGASLTGVATQAGAVPVSAVGDRAVWRPRSGGGALYVLGDRRLFVVQVDHLGTSDGLAVARRIAQDVIAVLQSAS